ncbi:MAG: hypothetical protein HY898_25385 [Deltaproteobacteria bacterium]|nr:hypothetical protein [Deltaproteobacteria bacterium]
MAQAPGAPYGQPPTTPYQQPPQAPYQQPQQPQFPPPQQQYQQPPQPQQQYQQPPQPQQPAPGYAQPPQAFGMPPAAPTMAAAGQPAYGAPPAPAQPLGSPGAAAPAGGDEDPERPLKIGGFPSKFGAAFCYAPFICGCLPPLYGLIAVFAEDKQNKFVRFHAIQSLMVWAGLLVFEIIVFILQMLVGMVLRMTGMYEIAGIIGIVFMALFSLVGLVVFAGLCAGVVLSFMGKPTRLPLIGNFAAKQAGMTV